MPSLSASAVCPGRCLLPSSFGLEKNPFKEEKFVNIEMILCVVCIVYDTSPTCRGVWCARLVRLTECMERGREAELEASQQVVLSRRSSEPDITSRCTWRPDWGTTVILLQQYNRL